MKKEIAALIALFISISGICQKTVSEKVTYDVYNYKCYHCGKIKKKTVIDVMSIKDKDVSNKVSEEVIDNGYSQGNPLLDAITGYSDVDKTTCNGSMNGRHSYNEISHTTTIKIVTAEKGKAAKEEQEENNKKAVEFKQKMYNMFYNYNKAYWADKSEIGEIAKRQSDYLVAQYDAKSWDSKEQNERDNIGNNIIRQFSYTQSLNRDKAIEIGNTAWKYYENKNLDSCITLSKKALSYYDSLPYIHANIGLCYLVKGEKVFTKETYDSLNKQEFIKYYKKAVAYSYAEKNLAFAINDIDGIIRDLDDLLGLPFPPDKNDPPYISIINEIKAYLKTCRKKLSDKVIVP